MVAKAEIIIAERQWRLRLRPMGDLGGRCLKPARPPGNAFSMRPQATSGRLSWMVSSGEQGARPKRPENQTAPLSPEPFGTEPPIMWSDSGSGFEAHPFSPAGTAQREWGLSQRLGRSRVGRLVVWIIIGMMVLVPLLSILVTILRKR